MRYAVVYSKGGVGKSTVALHLATHLAKQAPTLLIDGDPEERITTWITWRREAVPEAPTPTTVRLIGRSIMDEGREVAEGFTHTVIDSEGRDGPGLRNALLMADRVIVPLGYEGFDTMDLVKFKENVDFARDFNPDLKVKVLLARIHTQSKMGGLIKDLNEMGFDVFAQRIRELLVYRHVGRTGLTVHEYKPRSAAANHDMNAFYKELGEWT